MLPLKSTFVALGVAAASAAAPPAAPEAPVSFAEAARIVTASIQEHFYNEDTGLYARSLEDRGLEYMWGNGVMFSTLVAAARHEPETYRPVLERFFGAMDCYWDGEAPVPGYEPAPTRGNGHDKYYDDNQWMVITFLEAYEVTGEAKFLDRARATLAFALSGWDDELGGGIWWHEGHKGGSKNTCANGPAAVACLRAARVVDRSENLGWARRLVAWTNEHLQDEDGLFWDNQRVADGRINRGKLTYNSALMMRANLGLFRATGEDAYLAEAERIGKACVAFVNPKTGGYRNAPRFAHLLVEADLELFRATGDEGIRERAARSGRAAWDRWRADPPEELIDQAAIARVLWLLAEHESEAGRAFWTAADRAGGGE
jgi:hypothetical protein